MKDFESVRREWVDRNIAAVLGQAQQPTSPSASQRTKSSYGRALNAITLAATEYAKSVGASLDWEKAPYFDEILGAAIEFVDELRYGINPRDALDLWEPRKSPFEDFRNRNIPAFQRSQVETAVGMYLRLPYRAAYIDRLLVDLLIALELYAYGSEIFLAEAFFGHSRSPLRQRPFLQRVFGAAVVGAVLSVIGFLLWFASLAALFPSQWLLSGFAILLIIFIGLSAWSLVTLPFAWKQLGSARRKALGTLQEMLAVYGELASEGPFSSRHIEQRATKSSEAGVIWPAPLFALLDDINGRTGRF